jgi:DNA-binding response OmpR family regulator
VTAFEFTLNTFKSLTNLRVDIREIENGLQLHDDHHHEINFTYKVVSHATVPPSFMLGRAEEDEANYFQAEVFLREGGQNYDVMLPGLNGMEVLRRLRQEKDTPVIMLTARDAVMDKVAGLDAGADDYITKPFAIEELLARIRVALKKHARTEDAPTHKLEVLGVCLDEDRHEVTVQGENVELTNREFELLHTLMRNKNIVLTREKLLNEVCGYDYVGETNIIDVYVRYLRTKIDDHFGIKLIQTVRGVGYCIKES